MWLLDKRLSQTARILKLLKKNHSATNYELSHISLRYSGRIAELRQEGHNILAVRQVGKDGHMSGTWRYYLKDS